MFDIGGGSSELIWLDLASYKRKRSTQYIDRLEMQNCIAAWTSLPVGVVTLAERYGGKFVDAGIFDAMVGDVLDMLAPFEAAHRLRDRIRRPGRAPARHVRHGHDGRRRAPRPAALRSPAGGRRWLQVAHARTVTAQLLASTHAERVAQPCIGRDRADLVLAGCAILEALLRTWPCERLRVADRGLREGILATLMAEDGVYRTGARQGYWKR